MVVLDDAFNPLVDIKAVEPFGFIDLKEAFASGVVPSAVADSEDLYNGIDNPSSILGKPHDIFEAMNMESAINSYSSDADKNSE